MKMNRCLSILIMVLVLICGTGVSAIAHDVPVMSRNGSIKVSMKYDGAIVAGGTLTVYRVGDVAEDDGDYSFVLSEEFGGSGVSLEDIDSPNLASALESYAKAKEINGTTKTIDANGNVTFEDVKIGLYLAVQNKSAEGYNKVSSFLITVPMKDDDGNYLYNVDASPKVELEKSPENPPNPPEKDTPPPKLPQTGQLYWPIPVMAVSGLLIFSIGWMLKQRRGTRETEETSGNEK